MADQTADTVAQIIAQCRRDIAVAWTHIEAARDVLQRTRALQERLTEHIAANDRVAGSHEPAHHQPRSLGFVMIPSEGGRRSRRRPVSRP